MMENEIAKIVVDASLKIHRSLGPGLLESVYEATLAHELRARGVRVTQQLGVPVNYEGVRLDFELTWLLITKWSSRSSRLN